jgi:hypothetical protein
MNEDALKIRHLNDRFRQGDKTVPGETVMTLGIDGLINQDITLMTELFQAIKGYNSFTTDNDPHEEHDFGSFQFQDHTCFWKIDVYDWALKWASPDPTNPCLSKRVLTIMLAEEY